MNIINKLGCLKRVIIHGMVLGFLAGVRIYGAPAVLDSAVNPANGHLYYLLDNSNWTEAENAAIALGGHLVTINDQAEQDWVWGRWGVGRSLWIGLNDAAQEGTFVWANGETVGFTNWGPGEPNNGNGNEDWVYLMGAGLANAGSWNDFADLNNTPGQPLFYGIAEVDQTAKCSPSAPGITAWWAGEGNGYPKIGTNEAVFYGDGAFAAGEVGQGFLFNGTNAYVQIPASSSLDVGAGGALTLEAWINPFDVNGFHPIIEWHGTSRNVGVDMWLGHLPSDSGLLMGNVMDTTGNAHTLISAQGAVVPGVFQHIAMTYDSASGVGVLYLNGVAIVETTLGTFTPETSYDLYLSRRPGDLPGDWTYDTFFNGIIDELSIYNRALSSNEVAAIYSSGANGKCVASGMPFIGVQPLNQTVTVGTNVTFGVGALGTSPLAYQWYFNTTNLLADATNSTLLLTNVQLTQAGFYSVLVTNPLGSALSTNALLTVTTNAPLINTQPSSKLALLGSTTAFSVSATGSLPMSYQWYFNNTNLLNGETGPTLTLTNIASARGGYYRAVVSNAFGIATSSIALLAITFPTVPVQVKNAGFTGSSFITVPVTWVPNGNENALSLSMSFDSTRLTYSGVSLGTGSFGADLMLNISQVSTGRLGMWIAMPPGATFAPGTQQLAQVTFWVGQLSGTVVSQINFVDTPWTRQVWDAQLGIMSATYAGASLTLSPALNFEGDVYPRPSGDKSLAPFDWLMVGRYAARLDYPTNATEYQRADCAPRSTLGNGVISVADWVQAGRYIFGWDPLTALGGPTNNLSVAGPGASVTRVVTVGQASALPGHSATIPITLAAQGNENALGFTLGFNPALVQFTGASLGSGAASADLLVNANQAGTGQLGFALALPTGSAFPAGTNEVVRVTFQAIAGMSGSFTPTLNDQVVVREVADAAANALPVSYANSSMTVYSAPVLSVANAATGVELRWPAWAADFTLQATGTNWPTSADWTSLQVTPVVSNGESVVVLPLGQTPTYYRLYHP